MATQTIDATLFASSHPDIVKRTSVSGLIFSVAMDDVVLARLVLEELQKAVDIEAVNIDEKMAKVSIIGAGMLGQPGVAAQMFDILSQEGINIEIISTSEISISCLVAEDRVKDAVRVIHNGLLLDQRG